MSIRYTEVAEDGEVMLETPHAKFCELLNWTVIALNYHWFNLASVNVGKQVKYIIFDSPEE